MTVAIHPGLCSVTFRGFSCDRIIALAEQAGLSAIEWGTDAHLPPGDIPRAHELALRCGDAGISTPTIGSYFRLGETEDFAPVADTAAALGARRVRIWAGRTGSAAATPADRRQIEEALRRCCHQAAQCGLDIALEWHRNTLTDTAGSAAALMDAVDAPNLRTYWQPRVAARLASSLAELDTLAGRLVDLHVFHWTDDTRRLALSEGRGFWPPVLARIAGLAPPPKTSARYAFLEFVRNDDEDAFRKDAATLKTMLAELNTTPKGGQYDDQCQILAARRDGNAGPAGPRPPFG